MDGFGKVACLAAKMSREGTNPRDAWERSAKEIFPKRSMRIKNCPRCAFLGIAEDGLIVGVSSGNYTSSQDSKRYAIAGVDLLRKEPDLCDNVNEMWRRVMYNEQDRDKTHNEQMNVVAALWKYGYIKHSA